MNDKIKSVKYLLWDVDGTLLNFELAEKASIRMCFKEFNIGECSDEQLEVYKGINSKYWQQLERGEISKPELLVARFRDFFSLYNIDVSIAEEFDKRYQVMLGETACFNENAEETVIKLKEKYKQYGATNGTAVAQNIKLKKSGLNKIFDDVFISEEVGAEKPSTKYYEAVYEKVGSNNPAEYLMIGDSLTSDIKGGNNMGIATCWFNPEKKVNDKNVTVDYEITDLKELLDILS